MKYVLLSFLSLFIFLINFFVIEGYHFSTPFFMINSIIYKIISTIIYVSVNLSVLNILVKNKSVLGNKLKILLIINVFFYSLYNLFTFKIISPFLSFASKMFHFISILHLNEEIILQNKTSAKLLVPYIIWTFYLTLTSLFTFFINNT